MEAVLAKKKGWLNWGWLQWLILAVVTVIAVREVYQRQMERLQVLDTSDVEVIESDIQEYNTMAERLAQLEVLPPVEEQWRYLPAIANRYGVDLKVLNSRGGKSGMVNAQPGSPVTTVSATMPGVVDGSAPPRWKWTV